MNRYSNYTPSAYSPMSFEEIAMVPMMKRKQHDEMSKNLADLGIIPVDPLDQHRDEALQLKQDLESRLTNLSSDLASKGIDGLGKENFYKLQKERNDLIAPTGRIGKINQAKKIYDEEFKNYLEDATKNKGFSREDALYNWQTEHLPKYTGYNEDKEIININSYGAPKRHILQEDLKTVKSLLGENTQTLMKNNGFNFREGPNGSIVVMDGKGRVVETTNIPQLKEAADYLNSRWIQPTGEGTISAKFERIDPKRIVSEINNGLGMMKTYKLDDTRESDYSIQGYSAKEKDVDPTGIVISNNTTLTSDALSQPGYTDALTEIKRLMSSKSKNPADKAKLEDLIELRQIADSKLKLNKNYQIIDNEYKKVSSELEAEGKKMKISRKENEKDIDYFTRLNLAAGANSKVDKLKGKFSNINVERQKIKDETWKQSSSLRHNYSYLPSNPKEESAWNLHNENVHNVMKGVDLGNILDLTSIHTTGGTKKNLNDKDTQNIQELLKFGDPKSFKINNIKTYGDNKTPEITMTFNTTKEASEYDIDGETSWNDEYGGSEKPVTVTFKLKKFSNAFDSKSAVGYKNLSGAIADFWKDKGGINEVTGNFQGAEIKNALIENAYSGLSDKELYARAMKDSDAREALLIRVAKHEAKKIKK